MKKEYISESANHFKANLHCHSTWSDGKLTPAELKEIYMKEGYSIVAYSDHNLLLDHSELSDENFLAMIATEYDVKRDGPEDTRVRPCFHINFYPKKSHQDATPCYTPARIRKEFEGIQKHIGDEEYERSYENIQDMIDRFVDAGFLAQINHPVWSVQNINDYLPLNNFFAVELYNHGCFATDGFDEYNTRIWDDLLCSGKKVFGVATDDNHNKHEMTSPKWDSFGGFTVIQAEELTQESVTTALEAGKFYASTGPLIYSMVLEDNILKVKTSPVAKMLVTTGIRNGKIIYPADGEQTMTYGELDIKSFQPGTYVRLTIIDEKGNRAWSQPIYDYKEE